MKTEKLSIKDINEIIDKLRIKNWRIMFHTTKGLGKDLDITNLKNIEEYINEFIKQKIFNVFEIENHIECMLSLTKDNKDYKWVKPNEIYFDISIPDAYLRFFDDIELNKNYEEDKRITEKSVSKFLKVLKVIYETLKPEYGWGDNELNMYDRGFDYMDVTKPILIYSREIVEKIGRSKVATAPVKRKVKLSDGGYILLTENIGHYTPEVRDKIGKHLFGEKWNVQLILDRHRKLFKNEK